jgi:hypothetical protein
MSTCIFESNLLQNKFELFVEQLIILNKKIDKIEDKINNINLNHINSNHINSNNIIIRNNIDWDSIHLY